MSDLDFKAGAISSGFLRIDLLALAQNYRAIQSRIGTATSAAVLKADAYGLGAVRVATTLHAAGCRSFFTAHLSEALELQAEAFEDTQYLVLNGLMPGAEKLCADAGIVPVINSLEQASNWAAEARRRGGRLPAVLQVDTGMSRLGMSVEDLAHLVGGPAIGCFEVRYLMSHLASADDAQSPQNAEQRAAFDRARKLIPSAKACFANSGGIVLGAAYHGELVRPGIALYGGAPVIDLPNPMSSVVELYARVIQVRTVPAGTRVGYGGAFVAPEDMRLATIGAGYADGLPRHLGGRGAVYFGDMRLSIVGRVSMDSLTVDTTLLPAGSLTLGSFVEVIGRHQSLEDVASAAGTIAYEILTRLGRRYDRVYVGDRQQTEAAPS